MLSSRAFPKSFLCAVALLLAVGAHADQAADRALAQCVNATAKLPGFTAKLSLTFPGAAKSSTTGAGTISLGRPHFAKVDYSVQNVTATFHYENDGAYRTEFVTPKSYFRDLSSSVDFNGRLNLIPEVGFFFQPKHLLDLRKLGTEFRVIAPAKIGATLCTVLQLVPHDKALDLKLFIGPDHLLRGFTSIKSFGNQKLGESSELLDFKPIRRLDPKSFAFVKQKGVRLSNPPLLDGKGKPIKTQPAPKIGAIVPDFKGQSVAKVPIDFTQYRKAFSKTILLFWSVSNEPSQQEYVRLSRLSHALLKRNIGILTVSMDLSASSAANFASSTPNPLATLVTAKKVFVALGIPVSPVLLIVDSSGKVLSIQYGFDASLLRSVFQRQFHFDIAKP